MTPVPGQQAAGATTLGRLPPAPGALVLDRRRRRPRRWRRGGAGLIAAAALVIGAGVGAGDSNRAPVEAGKRSPGSTPAVSLRISWRRAVPAGVVSLTLADGSLWITGIGAVTRMDPASGQLTARISAPGIRELSDVVSFDGGIWISSGGFSDRGFLDEIDPATNRVVRTFPLPAQPSYLAAGGGYLWADAYSTFPDLLRFDPRTGTFRSVVALAGVELYAPAYGLGSVWVSSGSGQVWRIDPVTLQAFQFWPGPATRASAASLIAPDKIAVADGSVWISFTSEKVGRFNPATGTMMHAVAFRNGEGVVLRASAGAVWVLLGTGSSSPWEYLPDRAQPGRVVRLNPRTGTAVGPAVAIGASGGYYSVAASATTAWVGDFGTSTVIAVATGRA